MEKNNGFNDILTCFDLRQHVNFSTHVHGHWLDLLITKRISNSNKSVFSTLPKNTTSMDDSGNNEGQNPSSQSRTNMAQISHTSRSFSLQTSMPPVE